MKEKVQRKSTVVVSAGERSQSSRKGEVSGAVGSRGKGSAQTHGSEAGSGEMKGKRHSWERATLAECQRRK